MKEKPHDHFYRYHLDSTNVSIQDYARLICQYTYFLHRTAEDSLPPPMLQKLPLQSSFLSFSHYFFWLRVFAFPPYHHWGFSGSRNLLAKAILRILIVLVELVQGWGRRKKEIRWKAMLFERQIF